ncbi:hypothetical protein U1Q18_023667, partial [Sarracenia purpurea var. burkii]
MLRHRTYGFRPHWRRRPLGHQYPLRDMRTWNPQRGEDRTRPSRRTEPGPSSSNKAARESTVIDSSAMPAPDTRLGAELGDL